MPTPTLSPSPATRSATRLGTIQPVTFAQVACPYTSTTARCVCGETITLKVDGEWSHRLGLVWCSAVTR